MAGSPAYGALDHALRRAESHGLRPETLVPRLVADRPVTGSRDPVAVLHARLEHLTQRAGRPDPARLIAHLIPAVRVAGSETAAALTEREELIEQRADALVAAAIHADAPWLRTLGRRPTDPHAAAYWARAATAMAAYRDLHDITGRDPLGSEPAADRQLSGDRATVADAIRDADRVRTVTPTAARPAHVDVPAAGRSIPPL